GESNAPGVKSRGAPPRAETQKRCVYLSSRQSIQCRNSSSRIRRAFTLLFSASSRRLRLHSSSAQSGYTLEVKSRLSLLAAQTTPSASVEIEVSCRASPPFRGRIQICDLPLRVETKASDCPSGDQRGWLSDPSPCVNWRASPPALAISQRCVAFLSASRSTEV